MAKCRDCALLCWRPGCTAGGGDDFNTYVDFDDDSGCPSFRRAKQKPLMDVLAAALRFVWDRRYTDGDESGVTPGYTIRLTPDECDHVQAVLIRHKEEVGDAEV